MVYGDELIFSGAMTQLETEQWIQNMEDHMKENSVGRKDKVQYALQYFEKVLLLGGECTNISLNGKEKLLVRNSN